MRCLTNVLGLGLGLCFLLSDYSPSRAQTSYGQIIRQAVEAMQGDSLQRADSLLHQALKSAPNHVATPLVYRYLGQIREQLGYPQEALENYSKGLQHKADDVELRLDRAALLYRMGLHQRALSDYSDVLRLQPKHIEALQMRAHIQASLRNYKSARLDYETILHLEPLNSRAQVGLVLVNDRSGRPREALDRINALVSMFPDSALYRAVRGGMLHRRKQYEYALADLNEAIRLCPTCADYYISRATLYLDMRKRRLARQDTKEAVRLGADPREMAALLKKD